METLFYLSAVSAMLFCLFMLFVTKRVLAIVLSSERDSSETICLFGGMLFGVFAMAAVAFLTLSLVPVPDLLRGSAVSTSTQFYLLIEQLQPKRWEYFSLSIAATATSFGCYWFSVRDLLRKAAN